ncbi:MAG: hypothetical protein Q8Q42_00945 [Nanoarchaeota archaeon]|nr:hypothetical protein [Nanoarchaeota archaeon]
MIEELAESSLEELKRADHSIYVSLKYTRTVDIIKNTIKRLLSAFDISIIQGLEYAKENKKISSIPASSHQRALLMVKFYPQLKRSIEFYTRLKNVDRADYTKKEEYRKNVALIAKVGSNKVEVNTEELRNFFDQTVSFTKCVTKITSSKNFAATKKVCVQHPVKKIKKDPKKPSDKPAKKVSRLGKNVSEKSYKVNPHAKITGFGGY